MKCPPNASSTPGLFHPMIEQKVNVTSAKRQRWDTDVLWTCVLSVAFSYAKNRPPYSTMRCVSCLTHAGRRQASCITSEQK